MGKGIEIEEFNIKHIVVGSLLVLTIFLGGIWALGLLCFAFFGPPIIQTWFTEFLVGLTALAIIVISVIVVCFGIG